MGIREGGKGDREGGMQGVGKYREGGGERKGGGKGRRMLRWGICDVTTERGEKRTGRK